MTIKLGAVLVCTCWLVSFAAYDEEEARRFASLSSVTYCDDLGPVMNWTCTACNDSKTPLVVGKIKVVDGGSQNASRILVGKLKDQHGCLVAFRGSHNVLNWVRDFQFWDYHPSVFNECPGCEVHSGFLEIWQKVEDLVVAALSEVGCSNGAKDQDNKLYVTGHSLGAALVHLSMFALQKQGFHIAKTYSFEAPRIGNKAFAQVFSERFARKIPVYRITHNKDPVVHVPPMNLGYSHVQTAEVYYNSTGGYRVCAGVENSTSSCADQYWDLVNMLAFHTSDHVKTPLVPTNDISRPVGCTGGAKQDLVIV